MTPSGRVKTQGKFLYLGDEKFWVRGVTYGTFAPGPDGTGFPPDETVRRDFAAMAAHGFNSVRTYTVPPQRVLDEALRQGLRVMVGIPWAQHVTFLDNRAQVRNIRRAVDSAVSTIREHPAILAWTVGNEIPQPVVRWHGRKRVEDFIESLFHIVKSRAPESLVTYVNFPTTEYLQLPFLDLCCFNVYLESRSTLEAYLARLQNIAGERPLLMTEVGLDSRRNGEDEQARSLSWQVRTAFAAGCAGSFVFAWTDEWFRGGHDIPDWDFGLTTRERHPKPALAAVGQSYAEVPFASNLEWPSISVIVCTYNGSRTIRDTLEGLTKLNYPDYEVIVVDDGSTDHTAGIVREYGVRLIQTTNQGLSSARNTGWKAASGEIVAYIDDDAWPDPDWLTYLAYTFMSTAFPAVGGMNLAPPGDGFVAECVANAPGGPVHVLVSDREAEHIPGCNMAFRRTALEAVGGFDPQFRVAGDDVDICWKLQKRGYRIGFSPASLVWHHRRNSVRTYWRQQKGYGKAEALLHHKWPEKYNMVGHVSWMGRIYGRGVTHPLSFGRSRVYGGVWGTAPFQSLYEPAPGKFLSLFLMPEWYLVVLMLAFVSALATLWGPFTLEWIFLGGAAAIPVVQALRNARRATFRGGTSRVRRTMGYALVTGLYLIQPLARLMGRLCHGLTPWRRPAGVETVLPRPRRFSLWSETWRAPDEWVRAIESALLEERVPVLRGTDFDPWDLETRGGILGSTRLFVGVEEHGAGRQMVRMRTCPNISPYGVVFFLLLFVSSLAAAADGAWAASGILVTMLVLLVLRIVQESGDAAALFLRKIETLTDASAREPEENA